MVQLVVFYAPRLRQHPVEPVLQPSPHGAQREATTAVATTGVRAVVATMARMVTHHGPTAVSPKTQKDDGNQVGRAHPHGA